MTKSALVKVGMPPAQAESMKQMRLVRQILDQHDAAIARLNAATADRIREVVMTGHEPTESESTHSEPAPTVS